MLNKLISFLFCIFVFSISAATPSKNTRVVPQPIAASFVVDLNSKKVLHAHNSRKPIHPASLTKMMTVYLAFEALKSGKINPNADVKISHHASSAKPCKLGLPAGDTIRFDQAIIISVVKSANDVTRALAEKMAGSESKFSVLMNKKAKQLGMKHTHFRNATGWYDPNQKTTAEDMVKLAIALKRDFPEYYDVFSKTSFVFRGKVYHGHNHVTKNYPGAEGLKTGYIAASGFNLVTSATRDGKTLIGVVIGGKTAKNRDNQMIALLDKHFDSPSSSKILASSKVVAKKNPPVSKVVASNQNVKPKPATNSKSRKLKTRS
jgi:D-alanyl-D-alanine carboxypeptidase (penicillin-binding protein 5/6)